MCGLATPASGQSRARLADHYIQRGWGTADGLPQNTVTSMVQTRDGYLWLGTFGGLVRFDGHAFTVFDPGNTPGLFSSRIVSLHEDRAGRLWIGSEGGLTRLEGGRFTSYTSRDGLPETGVAAIVDDRRGRTWITGSGLLRSEGAAFSRFDIKQMHIATGDLAEAANGDLWVTARGGVARVAGDEVVTFVERFGEPEHLLITSTQQVLVGRPGLASWNGSRFVDVRLPLTAGQYGEITALAEDHDGSIWIGTSRAGVLRWHDGAFESYDASDGLTGNFVRSLLVDRDGHLWIGTDVGGLNRLKRRRVHSYQRPDSVEQSIGPIVGDGDGGLWIGATCGGLLDFHGGTFRVYELRDGLPNPCIWALHRDADGTLWIGTMGGGSRASATAGSKRSTPTTACRIRWCTSSCAIAAAICGWAPTAA